MSRNALNTEIGHLLGLLVRNVRNFCYQSATIRYWDDEQKERQRFSTWRLHPNMMNIELGSWIQNNPSKQRGRERNRDRLRVQCWEGEMVKILALKADFLRDQGRHFLQTRAYWTQRTSSVVPLSHSVCGWYLLLKQKKKSVLNFTVFSSLLYLNIISNNLAALVIRRSYAVCYNDDKEYSPPWTQKWHEAGWLNDSGVFLAIIWTNPTGNFKHYLISLVSTFIYRLYYGNSEERQ